MQNPQISPFVKEKKHFFERENIKRIKNKEGKNGRDVNHKEKPKESFFLSSLWGLDVIFGKFQKF